MSSSESSASPFAQYLAERFPVPAYLILIGAMVLGAAAAAAAGTAEPVPVTWRQAIIVFTLLLGFFVLRVFDEHKDYDKDLIAHPGRVLSRGLVTLDQLKRYGVAAFVLQLALNVALGWQALVWILVYAAFSVAMRYEFGVGDWLNRHIVIYAISHNPIVALMMVYAIVAGVGELPAATPVWLYLGVATLTSLGFEVGRKVRAPQDEKEGQDTYTDVLGPAGAALLMSVLVVGGLAVAVPLLDALWAVITLCVTAMLALVLIAGFGQSPTPKGAKQVELGSTLFALVTYIVVFADIAAQRGISWS